jgi:hypothetical protein
MEKNNQYTKYLDGKIIWETENLEDDKIKVKQALYRPGQALRFQGGYNSQNF